MRTILPHQQIKEDFVRVRELLRKIYRNLQKMNDLTKKTLKIGLIGGVIAGFISFLALYGWLGHPISFIIGISLSVFFSVPISAMIAAYASKEISELFFLLLLLFTPAVAVVVIIVMFVIFPF